MIKWYNISIRNKLILVQVFTSVFVLGIFFVIFIIADMKSYKERRAKSMISLAQVIGANSISTLEFQDNEAATGILSELHNTPDVVYAAITDTSGNIFARYSRTGADSFQIPEIIRNKKIVFSNGMLLVANDILNNKILIGKIYLEVELTELAQIKRSKILMASFLLFAAIILAFVIAYFMQGYISGRLLLLADMMKEVSRTGDYDKHIDVTGKNEISTLISGFNNLLLQVKTNQQRKDEFIGIASHELKTPLTSIKGYIELLNSIEDKEPNKEYVKRALKNVNKLERLIQDLLDVSKIQSGQLELTMRDFNVDQLIDETISSMQMVTETHEITREDEPGNQTITGDRQRIEQVLTNLLSNAIKYSPGERKVYVQTKKTDSELIIMVRDFGVGVPKEEQANIFERFYRTKDTSDTILGFGLGLYICRDIVKRHQGKIWVESQKKGSAFYFSLPFIN